MMMNGMGSSMNSQGMGQMGPAGYGYPGYVDSMAGHAGQAAPSGFHGAAAGTHGTATGLLGGGLDFTSLLTGLLNFTINIFIILLVIGLIVGVVVFLKRYLLDGNAGFQIPKAKTACTMCGAILQTEWNCCPKCGQVKVTMQPQVNQPQTV